MASGAAQNRAFSAREQAIFDHAVEEISAALARELVRDGEGATKLVSVEVRGARSAADAERAARKIANSPLVKTAFFGCDPNVGRILMAAGSSGAYLESDRLVLWIGGVKVAANGRLLVEALGEAGTKMRQLRICGAARFAARQIERDDPHLRSQLRLRANQRGVHNLTRGGKSKVASFIKVATVADIPKDGGKTVEAAGRQIALFNAAESFLRSTTPVSIAGSTRRRRSRRHHGRVSVAWMGIRHHDRREPRRSERQARMLSGEGRG